MRDLMSFQKVRPPLVVSVLCIVVLSGLGMLSGGNTARSQEAPTEYVTAQIGDVEKTVQASGNVMLHGFVDVGARVSGQIVNLNVSLGDTVKSGQLLAEIAPAVEAGRIENSRAQLARLRAELAGQIAQSDFAQLQFQRQSQLKAENATREEAYESSRMNMQAASARVDAIQAQIQQMEANIKEETAIGEQKRVLAPINGTVVSLTSSVGQMVTANRDVLMRLADLSKMTVHVPVAEEDVTRLSRGMSAVFTTPGFPGRQWTGKLKQIMPLPITDTGLRGKKAYYTVLFDVENTDHALLSGMTADVRFVLESAEGVVTIPASLVKKPDDAGMQTLKVVQPDNTVDVRQVKIGLSNHRVAEVLSGIAADERIIVEDAAKNTGK
jgi:macrolide-specific efflux system membrane fusion protein